MDENKSNQVLRRAECYHDENSCFVALVDRVTGCNEACRRSRSEGIQQSLTSMAGSHCELISTLVSVVLASIVMLAVGVALLHLHQSSGSKPQRC